MTRNKPRIFLTLHPRGKNSLGEARQKLRHSAFHWGILISPKHTCHPLSSISTPKSSTHVHFDVSDAMYTNPSTQETERDKWRFRVRKSSDPCIEFQILSRVFVGKVPRKYEGVNLRVLREELGDIALPDREQGHNCVSWTREALGVLVEMGVLEEGFEIENCMDVALRFADKCIAEQRGLGSVLDFTNRAGAFI
ncbi:uncharacterized protein BDV14DRAFT_178126 [Aspergillus stella-maris]|uniref:uncharacterized protein n=1 Tax=Aspergillus stella-maris TaxID=1810926 RepID=UPI003CCDF90C